MGFAEALSWDKPGAKPASVSRETTDPAMAEAQAATDRALQGGARGQILADLAQENPGNSAVREVQAKSAPSGPFATAMTWKGAEAAPAQPTSPAPAVQPVLAPSAAAPADSPLPGMFRAAAAGPAGILAAGADAIKEPVLDAGKTLVTGAAGAIAGGLHGIYKLITGAGLDEAAKAVEGTKDALTVQPTTAGGAGIVKALASPVNPLNWPQLAAKKVADYGVETGKLSPEAATVLETAGAAVAPGAVFKGAQTIAKGAKATIGTLGEARQFGSVGASGTSNAATARAALETASPELRQAAAKVKDINPESALRHAEADSLPVPIQLTKGQATQDLQTLSKEQNDRGRNPEIGKRFAEQNEQLKENINQIRDKAAPDVYGTNHVENGASIIEAYRTMDNALNKNIGAKYKALKDANGGQFPIDSVAFANSADAALHKALKSDYLASPIKAQLERFKNGEPMTFEQFETLRTNLATDMRTGKGNEAAAAHIVRQALEELPLPENLAPLKTLADEARTAARTRFELIERDPAYKAIINDKVAADDLINKFIVNGKAENIKTMIENLGSGTTAHQTMAAGIVNFLKNKAGIINESGNFSQAGYNRALQQVNPKLLEIVGPEVKKQLETLGNVARYTQAQPRGSFVNNSNTLVGAMSEATKGSLEGAANVAAFGVPIGTWTRKLAGKITAQHDLNQTLKPGAGMSMKDIAKK